MNNCHSFVDNLWRPLTCRRRGRCCRGRCCRCCCCRCRWCVCGGRSSTNDQANNNVRLKNVETKQIVAASFAYLALCLCGGSLWRRSRPLAYTNKQTNKQTQDTIAGLSLTIKGFSRLPLVASFAFFRRLLLLGLVVLCLFALCVCVCVILVSIIIKLECCTLTVDQINCVTNCC